MKLSSLLALTAMAALEGVSAEASSIYDFRVESIDGRPVSLEQYRGKVLLIVNVASRCGYTYQYEGLEALYKEYSEKIKEFCTLNYGVTFPMFAKIHVKGRAAHPLYRFLTDPKTNPRFSGKITWNFNKFLVGRDGTMLARFGTRDEPGSEAVRRAVEEALGS
jgi:glutathione peroxidase